MSIGVELFEQLFCQLVCPIKPTKVVWVVMISLLYRFSGEFEFWW